MLIEFSAAHRRDSLFLILMGSEFMKFIHIGDLHLGATPDAGMSWASARADEIWQALDQVLDAAVAQSVDFILFSGDVFHRQPLLRELKELNYKFSKVSPIRIVFIAGNHDYIKADSRYRSFQWSDNVSFFKSQTMECLYFKQENTYIYGLSYEDYEIEAPLYDDIRPVNASGCHILLAHGGDSRHIPMDYKKIAAAGFDYAALGHIHKPEMFPGGKMAYAGSLVPIDRNEIGAHGYILGEWDGESMHTQFVVLEGRQYIHFTVAVDGHMPWGMIVDFVSEEIEKRGTQHIYKVILNGFIDPDIDVDMEQIYRLGYVIEVDDQTEPDYDFDALYAANKDNVIGMYIQRVRSLPAEESSKKKALYYGMKALLLKQ